MADPPPEMRGGATKVDLMALRVAAAVCTRNRPSLLARALESLVRQRSSLAELLVVDNAPDNEATRRLVAERFPEARYEREPAQGLNFARNRALRTLQEEVVAFLDDDAVADGKWAERVAEVFRCYPGLAVCTGRVEPLVVETEAQQLFEANGGFSRGRDAIQLPTDVRRPLHGHRAPLIAWAVSVGNGASFALRRQAALDVGAFDEALDLGEVLPGGGDLDLFWRLLRAGYELRYDPEVLAWHEHRWDTQALAAQLAGHQRALVTFLCKSVVTTPGWDRLAVMGFLGWRLAKPAVRLVRRTFRLDPLPAGMLWRMGVHTWAGLGSYPSCRRLAGRRKQAARSLEAYA